MSKFIGRGRITLFPRNEDGEPQKGFFLGCADNLDLGMSVDTIQHFSKCTSADALDFQGDRQLNSELSMTLTEWLKKNVIVATRGTEVPDATGGSVSNEAHGTGWAVGDVLLLGAPTGEPKTNVSAVVIEDGGTPMVLNTDYTLNADTGTVTFLTAPSGAVTADYTYDNLPYISFLTSGRVDYWLRFDGVNKANADEPVMLELYKVQFNPVASLGMLTDELAPLELSGAALQDDTKPADGDLGQFGRMTILA